jgi:hypothetical protein
MCLLGRPRTCTPNVGPLGADRSTNGTLRRGPPAISAERTYGGRGRRRVSARRPESGGTGKYEESRL